MTRADGAVATPAAGGDLRYGTADQARLYARLPGSDVCDRSAGSWTIAPGARRLAGLVPATAAGW